MSDTPPPAADPFPTEDALLAWLRELDPELEQWIGDDTVLLPEDGPWVVTVDTQIEGTHYLPCLDAKTLARRLIAVNLSDLAAAGAAPAYCLLSLATPPSFDHRLFFRAFLETCHEHRLQLAGGDLARSSLAVASLTVLGRIPAGGRWLSRTAAEPGDSLWLGGQIGASALGRFLLAKGLVTWHRGHARTALPAFEDPPLQDAAGRAVRAHLDPAPQLALGFWLGTQDRVAAIDLSDGLAKDLTRLCQASEVGAAIDFASLPLPAELGRLSVLVQQPQLEIALTGGEDYVLLFSLPSKVEPPSALRCHRIGTLTEGCEISWVGIEASGEFKRLGWDHFQDA